MDYPRNVRCWYCGTELTESNASRDHQTPRSQGGTNHPGNLVDCCRLCNTKKGGKDVEGYRLYLWKKSCAGSAAMKIWDAIAEYYSATPHFDTLSAVAQATEEKFPMPKFFGES